MTDRVAIAGVGMTSFGKFLNSGGQVGGYPANQRMEVAKIAPRTGVRAGPWMLARNSAPDDEAVVLSAGQVARRLFVGSRVTLKAG